MADTIVVVGSGPCGSMAAHVLVAAGLPVTMLESGTQEPHGFLLRAKGRNLVRRLPALDDSSGAYVTSGDPATQWSYHLAPGGLSNQWTSAVPRFAPGDFEDGARLGTRFTWPLTYDDLVPYYERAERLLHISGSTTGHPSLPAGIVAHRRSLKPDWKPLVEASARGGQGLGPTPLADGSNWLLLRRGTSFNSFSTIVGPLTRTPRFEMRLGAHAVRLQWDGDRRRVTGVIYLDRASGAERLVEAAAVVLACGCLHTTKLLFDSACADFPEGLGNSAGLLGRYLHDHPKEWWSVQLDEGLSAPRPTAYLTRRPYATSTPLLATSWTIGAVHYDRIRSFTPLDVHRLGVQVFGTMPPSPDHRVRPHPERRDESGAPVLDICLRFEPAVVENMIAARQHFVDLLGAAGIPARLDPVDPQLQPGRAVHYGGTARMHRSPALGVVDGWNRLHDVPNVVVADSSCFTTTPEKNPTLTAMALAARAADRLAHDVRRGPVTVERAS